MSPCRGKSQFLPCLLDWSDTWFAFYSQPLLLSCSFFWNMVLCCLLSIYILVASCYIISGALSHYGWHWHGVSIAHSGHSIFYVRPSAIQRLFSSIYIFMGNHWMHYLVCRYGRDPKASLLVVQKDNAQKIPFITFTHLLGPLFFLHRAVFILMIYNRPRVQTPSGIFTLHQQ